MNGGRSLALAAVAAIALSLGATAVRAADVARAYGSGDLLAFYCAGAVANDGADPYLAAPLGRCERHVQREIGVPVALRLDGVDAAPLPLATIQPFRLLALLPFAGAAWLFTLLTAAACAFTVGALARATDLPWWALAVPVALGDFDRNATFGQIPPFALAAAAASGLALVRRRPALAGWLAALTLLQPNAGLPILAALVLWVPGARRAALAGAAVFTGASLLAGGLPANVEYVRGVLPAQAFAEVSSANQLSLTWLAWFLRVPDALALRIGAAGYAIVAGTAVLLARRAATALHSEAAIVWLPGASAVAFGAYAHANQLTYAAPLALAVAANGRPAARAVAWSALLLVTLPFFSDARDVVLLGLVLVAVAVRFASSGAGAGRRVAIGAVTVAVWAGVTVAIARLPATPVRPMRAVDAGEIRGFDLRLASATLGTEDPASGDASLRELGSKLPPWTGLALLLGAAARASLAKGNQSLAEEG